MGKKRKKSLPLFPLPNQFPMHVTTPGQPDDCTSPLKICRNYSSSQNNTGNKICDQNILGSIHTHMNDANNEKWIPVIMTNRQFKQSLWHHEIQKLVKRNYLKYWKSYLYHDVVPKDVDLKGVAKPKHGTKSSWQCHANGEEQSKVHSLCHNPTAFQAKKLITCNPFICLFFCFSLIKKKSVNTLFLLYRKLWLIYILGPHLTLRTCQLHS